MTKTLVLALYAEGRTDERFLPIIIQRTAEAILVQRGRAIVDVADPIALNHDIAAKAEGRRERVLEAARRAHGYHALVVHADEDHPTAESALEERIRPGVRAARAEPDACHDLIPLVPVRMTEAWMLADSEALSLVVGASPEGLPPHPHQVESEPTPKEKLEQIIQDALARYPRRRRRPFKQSLYKEFYEPLARQISLERLRGVPAYRQFEADLTDTLIKLNYAT